MDDGLHDIDRMEEEDLMTEDGDYLKPQKRTKIDERSYYTMDWDNADANKSQFTHRKNNDLKKKWQETVGPN